MRPRFEYDDAVRVIRNVRNDGTFPGRETGELLIRRGSVGHVRDVGTFLQDQLIYTVHFLEDELMVGCREEELIPADAPWTPSRFEFRDKVRNRVPLGIQGEIIVEQDSPGEIIKVLRDAPEGVAYHVFFEKPSGRVLQVPESVLVPLEAETDKPA